MAKLTLNDLRKLRDEKQKEFEKRDSTGAKIVVGMGTCGIAAGAKETFNAIIDELNAKNISHVQVRQTGCMGLCHSEPTVEVIVPDMPAVIYGNVNAEVGKQIVNDHIVNKYLIDNHICDKPAMDIVR
ncbi:MAG TPA: (2Fe-2S) ferredoxin domain-containing protein [Kiritimatiellia bacterium]|jgi:NADP-reducing hydrogenase subunit HndB|nr:(2Fe-2S) ferredoxin domain-containing protein [Kiritimatiellia bacterium]